MTRPSGRARKARFSVPNMGDKLDALYQHATDHPECRFPDNHSKLADALKETEIAGTGSLDASRISKVVAGERYFSQAIHAAILAAYGIPWPCPAYTAVGLDAFRRMLLLIDGAITLIRERTNEPEFPAEDLYVLEIEECADGKVYEADLTAKPTTISIGGEEDLTGVQIGVAGFREIVVHILASDGVELSGHRPADWGKDESGYAVRDRSSGTTRQWQVRGDNDADRLLDANIAVCRIKVSSIGEEDRIEIRTVAPVPEFALRPDYGKISSKNLERYTRIAQNRILEKYSRNEKGVIDPSKPVLTIGRIILRRGSD